MDAKKHLQKAINLNPDYAEAYYELGLILKKEGETEEALNHFQKAQPPTAQQVLSQKVRMTFFMVHIQRRL